jgi:hypothetical protein
MKKQILLIVFFLVVATWNQAGAQQLSAQNTYEVSKKAKAGSIIDITTDEAANDIAITYFVKAKEDFWGSLSALNFETYHFDLNFQFKSMEPIVMDIKKARGKYKGFKFNGDEYSVEGVNMVALSATVTLKKKLTTYKWDWFAGRYNKTVKVLDKVSLKDDNENKLYKGPQFETDSTLAFIATGAGSNGGTKFHLIKVDKDINVVKRSAIEFPYACSVANGKEVRIEEDGVEKWYYVALWLLLWK